MVVAIDVGPGFDSAPSRDLKPPPALIRAHNDSQHVLMAANTEAQLALWRLTDKPPLLYVRPRVHRGETFAVEQLDSYFAAGQAAAREALLQRA